MLDHFLNIVDQDNRIEGYYIEYLNNLVYIVEIYYIIDRLMMEDLNELLVDMNYWQLDYNKIY